MIQFTKLYQDVVSTVIEKEHSTAYLMKEAIAAVNKKNEEVHGKVKGILNTGTEEFRILKLLPTANCRLISWSFHGFQGGGYINYLLPQMLKFNDKLRSI